MQGLIFFPFIDVNRIKKTTDLRERSFGVMERKPCSEFEAEAKKFGYERFWIHVPEGGESETQVFERAKKFIKVHAYP